MANIIGLIGGLSWASSIEYYRILNEESNRRLAGENTCESLMYSVNLPEYLSLALKGDINTLADQFEVAANRLIAGGAGVIEICSNTMHIVFDELERRVSVPLIHIVDPVAEKAKAMGIHKIGLIGTPVTMREEYYRGRLARHGLETIVPDDEYWGEIFRVIEEELTFNIIRPESLAYYLKAIENLRAKGAEGVILGCTEIPLLVHQKDTDLPVFDTTELHAIAAVDWALK